MAVTQESELGGRTPLTYTTDDILVRPHRQKPGSPIRIRGWAGAAAFSTDHFFDKPLGQFQVSLAHIHQELGQLVDRIPFTILTSPGLHMFPNIDGYVDIYRFKPTRLNRRLPREYPSGEIPQNPHAIRIALTSLPGEYASLRPQDGGALFVMESGDKDYAAHIGSVIGNGKTMSVSSDGWIAPHSMRHVEVLLGPEHLSGVKYILAGIRTLPVPGDM